MTADASGNGRFHEEEELDDAFDDDAPLTSEEAEAADAEAGAEADETLDERIEAVVEVLDGVERRREGTAVAYLLGGRAFAVLLPDSLEVALDAAVAKAALRTADTRAASRGSGWIAFTPKLTDRFALDRAEAWVRSAYRRATTA
jgi:hypothetical protein